MGDDDIPVVYAFDTFWDDWLVWWRQMTFIGRFILILTLPLTVLLYIGTFIEKQYKELQR